MDTFKKTLTLLNQLSGLIFITSWILVVIVSYGYYQPNYLYALEFFQYVELFIFLGISGITFYFSTRYFHRLPVWRKWLLTGGIVWLLILLLSAGLYCYQFTKVVDNHPFTIIGLFSFLWINLKVQLALFLVIMKCYVLGNFALNKLRNTSIPQADLLILSIGTGIMILSLLGMTISSFGGFKSWIIIPMGVVSLILLRKSAFYFIKNTLFTPFVSTQKYSMLGVFSLWLLVFWVTINFIGMIKPIPIGFDSLTLYMRLPAQIYDTASLVKGYPPYYWSVFMAYGYVLFQDVTYVLALSFLGGLLSLIAFYRIARLWLDTNYAYTCLLLFYSLPMINFLAYNDMKIDLGLLFMLLCTVLLLVNWVQNESIFLTKSVNLSNSTWNNSFPYKNILLLGLFSGFAVGVKLTALFAIFGILAIFSLIYFHFYGLIATVLLSLFAIILLQIDQLNGLRTAFLGIDYLKWICFLIGASGLGYFTFQAPHKMKRLVKTGLIYGCCLILIFSPWPVKNYLESGKTDLNALVYGQFDNQVIDIEKVKKIWRDAYNN